MTTLLKFSADSTCSTRRREMAQDPAFTLLAVDNAAIFASLPFIDRHNINASDAHAAVVDERSGQRSSNGE